MSEVVVAFLLGALCAYQCQEVILDRLLVIIRRRQILLALATDPKSAGQLSSLFRGRPDLTCQAIFDLVGKRIYYEPTNAEFRIILRRRGGLR